MAVYIFKVAKTAVEINECQKLLYKVFVEEEGFELTIPDKFESRSVYYYAKYENGVVACLRFVGATQSEIGLPLHDPAPYVSFDNRFIHAEVSRWVVAKDHRGKMLSTSSYKQCWETAEELGYDFVVSEARYAARSLHKRIGFKEYSEAFYDPDMSVAGDVDNQPNAIIMRAKVSDLVAKNSINNSANTAVVVEQYANIR